MKIIIYTDNPAGSERANKLAQLLEDWDREIVVVVGYWRRGEE